MSVWDAYLSKREASGLTKRETVLQREKRLLNLKTKDSLSFHNVVIDGEDRNVSIINSDNLNEKTMCSLPGEDFDCGSLVTWAGNNWLITEKDANNEVYTKGKLLQCNHLLKWIDENDVIHEQWCVIEDGTKLRTLSFRVKKFACKNYLLNCWKLLKPISPQRNDETGICVTATKVETKYRMVHG